MATTISTQDLENARRDIDDIGKAVNENVIVSPRYGEDFKSLPMIAAEFQISSDAAEAAAVSAAESAGIAQSSANIAEAAATAATISAGVFETPEAGVDPVTGVADGAYFNVRSSSDESYIDEYQNIGGVPTPSGKSYPSSEYVRTLREAIINPATGKADAKKVFDGNENQHQINNTTVRVAVSVSDMLDINNPKNGQTVFAKGLQGGTFIYDSNKSSINDGVVTFNGWVRQIDGFITPFMAGAGLDGSDSSAALQIAFNYSQDNNVKLTGLGKTFHCNDVIFDSNLQFYDAYLVCSKFDTDMISVIKTRDTIDPENTTKDFYFYNIHIDGRRALHTNIVGALGEDGGRHGFRIRNIIENGVWENCSANYCAVDGFEFFVGGYDSTRNDLIRNCKLIDCEAQWNGRHGASSDAENGLEIIRGKYKNNGKDLTADAPYSSGNSARRLTGEGTALYGVGWDFETYHPDTHPKNIRIVDVDMRDNARQSITFYRPNNPNQPLSANNITIDGGRYNSGLIDGDAITFTTFGTSNVGLMYDGVVINNVDLGGQNLTLIGVKSTLSNIKNYRRIDLSNGITYADKEYNHTVYDNSPFYVNLYSNQATNSLGKVKQNYNLDLPIGSLVGDITSINIKHESKRGGISFKMESSGYLTTYFYAGATAIFAVGHDGGLYTQQNGLADIGSTLNRFRTIYLINSPAVGSDLVYKKDVRDLSSAEKAAALELKSCIKSYNLIAGSDKRVIGIIAQEVVEVFSKHGLDAHEYSMIVHEDGFYSIRYDELIMFILSAS